VRAFSRDASFLAIIIRIPQAKVNNSNVADIWCAFSSAVAPASFDDPCLERENAQRMT